jgi:septal ring factor EnvC (AmiA/AmiB activator)
MNHRPARGCRRGSGVAARPTLILGLVVFAVTACSQSASAQRRQIDRQIRDNRQRLEDIRQERSELEAELRSLRGRARDITSELGIIDQQRTATSRLVNELDRQMSGLSSQADTMTFELILAEDAIAEKQAVLERRITEIYKRGRLWAFEVLLAAESFGDLLSRYKYLYLVTQQDRTLTEEVQVLRNRIASQRRDLLSARNAVSSQRAERDRELQRYVNIERERQRTLEAIGQSERRALTRVDSLARDEERLSEVVAALERARRAAVARGEVAEATISVTDIGTLDWPVDGGEILYRWGPQRFRDGTSIRYQGIGIGVPVGTPVRVVRQGTVASVSPRGTFGPTVIVDHGAGYYTLYAYMQQIGVAQGQPVVEGQVIGTSGGEGSDQGPHLEFQIRQTPENATTPISLDPLHWLKKR